MKIEMIDKIIDEFYFFCINRSVVEINRNYMDGYLGYYAEFRAYCDGNYHHDSYMINNYMLCIEYNGEGKQWDYDIFSDSIDIGVDNNGYEYITIDTYKYDLTQNLEELAFQLSTVYNLGCSTEQFVKILEIAQLLRDNNDRLQD